MATNAEKALEIFKKSIGNEEGVGDWHRVTQEQINQFADATLDHQFIHVDPEKSAQLSPYKVTIAHGFLTLSMVVHLGASIPRQDPEAYRRCGDGRELRPGQGPLPQPGQGRLPNIRARRQLVSAELKNPDDDPAEAARHRSRSRAKPEARLRRRAALPASSTRSARTAPIDRLCSASRSAAPVDQRGRSTKIGDDQARSCTEARQSSFAVTCGSCRSRDPCSDRVAVCVELEFGGSRR